METEIIGILEKLPQHWQFLLLLLYFPYRSILKKLEELDSHNENVNSCIQQVKTNQAIVMTKLEMLLERRERAR